MGVDAVTPRRRFTRLRTVFARRRPLSCQEMVELVTDYLEDALDARERARFEKHLQGCDGCATYLEELRVTVTALGTPLVEEHLDPVFRDRLMVAFAEATNSW
jgi:anti-sigma factor RsiW